MSILNILESKKNNHELSKEEIEYFIVGFTNGEITDYQASALLMAICINGMTDQEIFYFTNAMINSGKTIVLPNFNAPTIDKHSTGGVGDKTSLIILPILAAFGFFVPKMSGRGLGHTGGTLDKLESFDGFSFKINQEDFINQVKEIGLSIIGQTENLVPADKLLYALRDVTSTVDSIPLIASSIMAKKIASGADKILLDVKCGDGAFMKTEKDAVILSEKMVKIGTFFNKETIAHITNMEAPLGRTIGNALEVKEAIDCLNGKFVDKNLKELVFELLSGILISNNIATKDNVEDSIEKMVNSGLPITKFKEMIISQGSSQESFENIKISKNIKEIKSNETGFVNAIKAGEIGESAMNLGAGRKLTTDEIDLTVGIELVKVVGDYVQNGEIIAKIYYNDSSKIEFSEKLLLKAYTIEEKKIEEKKMIINLVK